MQRIIFKCPYLRGVDNTAHLSNLVSYIATRDGVQKFNDKHNKLSSTKNRSSSLQIL